jgi:GTPase
MLRFLPIKESRPGRSAAGGSLFSRGVHSVIKFADEATITVSAGKGGDGCVAFRREKFVPFGGPAGGDGGRGGDVVFEVRRNLRTLAQLRYQQNFKAENGQPGMGKNMHGRDGGDVLILVPPGTILMDADTGELIKDFGVNDKNSPQVKEGERWTFLKGGKGGWGNTHFKTSVNQAPRQFQPGQPAKSARLRVELQLIADIGFVGFPNAGKSSLLDHFTNARPKIAPYPFTTKIPNLGMLTMRERDIVLADIPGIIEGAHEGLGLGLRFLKHIARTSALAFLVDLSDDNWESAFEVLLGELSAFAPGMPAKRRVLIATKLDLPEAEDRFEAFRSKFAGEEVYGISVFSGRGIDELREAFFSIVVTAESSPAAAISPESEGGAVPGGEDLFGLGGEEGEGVD